VAETDTSAIGRRVLVKIAGRLCDAVLPGTGMLLTGNMFTGMGAVIVWALVVLVVTVSICMPGFHPLKALFTLGVLYAAFEVMLWLEPMDIVGPALRPRAALGGLVAFIAIVASGIALAMSAWCVPVVVEDMCGYPGLLPGEVVLVERDDFVSDPPVRGELVAAKVREGIVLARVVGIGGDRVHLSGPTVVINDAVIESEELGTVWMPGAGDLFPKETHSLSVYREVIGGLSHDFFYGRGVMIAPTSHEVPGDQTFLLCDNRSTARSADSRELGPFSAGELVGRPLKLLWSCGPGGAVRFDRIGTAMINWLPGHEGDDGR